ncbi:pyrroline-5-carboxylate reductase [Aquabacterium sp. J223]|uniref:pyrroline-5-carboxylate reductase n=1 Tax=Aquabacterium sp. J223 TaxID=2898431 RepID=UPI0021ADE15F|nr:pyrroline-5-carboxylate reductase [Aquabacterium sp. J223]UUX96239.1 pyrroline-5-carboxylate reductase [Aquabacterium sp. J223]
MNAPTLAFVGGGNMAGAILGGLLQDGRPANGVLVVEPHAPAREALTTRWPGLQVLAQADARLADAALVVWAVKPQLFQAAAAPCRPFVGQALQLSVMAGLRSDAIAAATGSARVVRCMPNTPALIGQGMTGLFARDAVSDDERGQVEQVLSPTGQLLWVRREADLDAVTALSGSGPAYVFYFVEAMVQAAEAMGLTADEGRRLALATFAGAAALAQRSAEPPAVLRERVTSKGGTTHAALTLLESRAVKQHFIDALQAARQRAVELGDEFGRA